MRKFVLALVVVLVGFVDTTQTTVSANGGTSITVTENNSRYIAIEVTRQPTVAQYILVCAIGSTECTPENAENSNKVVRFDCHSGNSHTTPHPCTSYNSTASNHSYYPASPLSMFLRWRPNNPSNYGQLPAGTYNLRVFESATGASGTYNEVDNKQFSFPQYTFTFDSAPRLIGDPLVGSTLTVSSVRWSPTPASVDFRWLRCKKAIAEVQDTFQLEDAPYTVGELGNTTADCLVLNQDGSIKPPSLEFRSIRTQSTNGFQSYTLTEADIGSFIVVTLTPAKDSGESREYSLASTSIIEKKTAPVNQMAPTSSFKKTKKIKNLQVGVQVSVSTGTWKWASSTAIQWYNCSKKQRATTLINAKQCKAIKRATKSTYKVKKSDAKQFLVAQITATNELGSTIIYSNNLGKVK